MRVVEERARGEIDVEGVYDIAVDLTGGESRTLSRDVTCRRGAG